MLSSRHGAETTDYYTPAEYAREHSYIGCMEEGEGARNTNMHTQEDKIRLQNKGINDLVSVGQKRGNPATSLWTELGVVRYAAHGRVRGFFVFFLLE